MRPGKEEEMPATLNTSFAADYLSGCYPAEPFATNAVRKGRACLKLINVTGSSDDLAFAAYLVHSRLGDLMRQGADYVTWDFEAVGEVSDMITDEDAELLAQIDPALRERCSSQGVGSMTPEVTAVHDLLLEMSAALAAQWAEEEGA
jgi:hypothetical protein